MNWYRISVLQDKKSYVNQWWQWLYNLIPIYLVLNTNTNLLIPIEFNTNELCLKINGKFLCMCLQQLKKHAYK